MSWVFYSDSYDFFIQLFLFSFLWSLLQEWWVILHNLNFDCGDISLVKYAKSKMPSSNIAEILPVFTFYVFQALLSWLLIKGLMISMISICIRVLNFRSCKLSNCLINLLVIEEVLVESAAQSIVVIFHISLKQYEDSSLLSRYIIYSSAANVCIVRD